MVEILLNQLLLRDSWYLYIMLCSVLVDGPISEVGFHTKYGYARSLARFAAKLGPVAWRVASKKIERCLPPGEDEAVTHRRLVQPLPVTVSHPLPPQHLSQTGNSSSAAAVGAMEPGGNKPSVNLESDDLAESHVASHQPSSDGHSSKPPSPSVVAYATTVASSVIASSSRGPGLGITKAVKRFSPLTTLNVLNSSLVGVRPGPPLQIHQNSMLQQRMNGANGPFGFNIPVQMGKLIGVSRPTGLNLEPHPARGRTSKRESDYVSNKC
ncbi:hypothetical protein Ancab_017208 [Ancistrocladus abbreviatus]